MSNRTPHHQPRDTAPCEPNRSPRILIVNDEDIIRGQHEKVLSLAGYGTERVCNGEEALIMLAAAEFDLVITDRHMLVLDGISLVRRLRAAGSIIPGMMVSGSLADGGELPADVRNEVAWALPKPARLSELLTGIVRCLDWHPAIFEIPCTA